MGFIIVAQAIGLVILTSFLKRVWAQ